MTKMFLSAAAGLRFLTATLPANAGVDVNVHVGNGHSGRLLPLPSWLCPDLRLLPRHPYVVVGKGDRGKHLGHYKHKGKNHKHKH